MAKNSDVKYFKSKLHGLEIQIRPAKEGEVAPKVERFTPYYYLERGVEGRQKIGLLMTDNGSVIKALLEDPSVEEIDEAEYEDITTDEVYGDDDQPLSGVQAPR